MKLYWRYKKDGKWTWKAVPGHAQEAAMAIMGTFPDRFKMEEE